MKPSEVLAKAADLIEPERAWTQGAYARDQTHHRMVSPESPEATCWCVRGATYRIDAGSWNGGYRRHWDVIDIFERAVERDAADFNDAPGRTQAEVVAALRKAADLARADGQ